MQTRSRLFDDLAKVASGAASTVVGLKQEIETIVRQQMERLADELGFVRRDEFEALQAVATNDRTGLERLEARVLDLESKLAATGAAGDARGAGGPSSAG